MVPHTPPFVDGDTSQENRVTAEWLNWVNERVSDTERFLGFYDASSGNLPQVDFPSAVFLPGDNYEISVAGTLDVVDPVTLLSAPTLVSVGDFIRWVYNSPTNPDGWYHVVPNSTIIASNVGFSATPGISATDVQAAIEELGAEAVMLVDLIAANVGYTPSGDLVGDNVQLALDELEAEKAPLSAATALGTSFTPTGSILATDVQNAIEEVAVLIGSGGGGYASSITNVPAGNISSTNVQAAINELDSDKVAKAGDTMTGDLIGPDANFDRFQIGRSVTTPNDFTIDASGNDGILSVYRGVPGTPLGAVLLTFNADDTVSFSSSVEADRFICDDFYIGRYTGPASGNFFFTADGTGQLSIVDDVTFRLSLKGDGSTLTSTLSVGGTASPNANTSLDILGIKPMALPRLTTTQRNAVSPIEGMFCFDTDLNTVYQYTGAAWQSFGVVGAQTTSICMSCSDETTALTSGTAKITFRMPYAMTLTAVRASLTTAQASGSIFTVDINEGGTTILSTKLTIDNTEKTSTTAATPAVISDTALANDAEITVDIDQVGTSGATGLKVYLIGTI